MSLKSVLYTWCLHTLASLVPSPVNENLCIKFIVHIVNTQKGAKIVEEKVFLMKVKSKDGVQNEQKLLLQSFYNLYLQIGSNKQ